MSIFKTLYRAELEFTDKGVRINGEDIEAKDIIEINSDISFLTFLIFYPWSILLLMNFISMIRGINQDGSMESVLRFLAVSPFIYWIYRKRIVSVHVYDGTNKQYKVLISRSKKEIDDLMKKLYNHLKKLGVKKSVFGFKGYN